jgi:hypothetical protein
MSVITILPCKKFAPNSEPEVILTFSFVFPYKKAFPMSHEQQESSYSSPKKKLIHLIVSLQTTAE